MLRSAAGRSPRRRTPSKAPSLCVEDSVLQLSIAQAYLPLWPLPLQAERVHDSQEEVEQASLIRFCVLVNP